jgi:hypothetical protein
MKKNLLIFIIGVSLSIILLSVISCKILNTEEELNNETEQETTVDDGLDDWLGEYSGRCDWQYVGEKLKENYSFGINITRRNNVKYVCGYGTSTNPNRLQLSYNFNDDINNISELTITNSKIVHSTASFAYNFEIKLEKSIVNGVTTIKGNYTSYNKNSDGSIYKRLVVHQFTVTKK